MADRTNSTGSVNREIASPMAPDSLPSEDDDSETLSLSASITEYPSEWGRTYHKYKEDSYFFPNDHDEMERLTLQHCCLKKIHGGKLYFAPISQPQKILDIGTGTGQWPIELAELFPLARITGTDLSAIQPQEVPPNVSFEIDDCSEEEWGRKPSSIDFIHTGGFSGSLASFSNFITTAQRYLKPGTGWLECHEVLGVPFSDDDSIPRDWAFSKWERYLTEAFDLLDPPRPLRIADKIARWMRDAGYVDIHERVEKMPMNPWPRDPELKRLGKHWELNLMEGLAGFSYKALGFRGLGWTKEQIELFLVDVRKAIRDRRVHAYHKIYVVYGRRPHENEKVKRTG